MGAPVCYEPTTPAERCTAHDGAHTTYLGACYALGSQVKRPTAWRARPVVCRECGAEMDVVKLPGGRTTFLTAGTDQSHWHAPAPKIELDEDRLAAAIVAASRAARQDRREASRQATPAPVAAIQIRPAPPADPPPERPVLHDDIPTVTVWSPERDDGSQS